MKTLLDKKQGEMKERMKRVHEKHGKTEMFRSSKVKVKKEEKKEIINEETKDWNNYIGDLS